MISDKVTGYKGFLDQIFRNNKLFIILAFLLFISFSWAFVYDLKDFWFNSEWTTDDALQQVYPLHKVHSPDLFKGDLITKTMEGYLAPLHYGLSYLLTVLTGDPLMMAHWVMLIQILICLFFIFLSVNLTTNIGVASFACFWFLHTRSVMQRFTSGLPRGWAAVVIAAFIYFALKKNHKAILITIFIGCLLHPPGAFICAFTYGLWLTYEIINKTERKIYLKHFLVLAIIAPLYIGTVYFVVKRPPEIGQMVDYQTALTLPEFQYPAGRFPFVPLRPLVWELRTYAFQPFWNRLHNPGQFLKDFLPIFASSLIILFAIVSVRTKREIIPKQLLFLLVGIISAYTLSRIFAFKLYVPDRHLQMPMSLFWVITVPTALHKLIDKRLKKFWYLLTFILLLIVINLGTGDGLQGSANFNYSLHKRGGVFVWLEKNTPTNSVIAGHPTHIDGLQLFAKRQAFATTETAHPFYMTYFTEIKRRLAIELKAHYSRDLEELVKLLEPEKIDYFVFSKQRFYPEALEKEDYFEPLNALVKELCSRHYSDYAYKLLPREVDTNKYPFLVFRDEQSAVVDLKKLKEFLKL